MIETIAYRTVRSFLEGISPLNKRFSNPLFSNYIYRGHGNSSWKLVPSAFREKTKTPRGNFLETGYKNEFRSQRDLEWEVLKEFLLEINHHGYHIPDEKLFYNLVNDELALEESNSIGRYELPWPAPEYYSLLALAQHYGLPTRLMDWSKNAYVASYFAASECVRLQSKGERIKSISLYALNIRSSLLNVDSKNIGGFWDSYHEYEQPRIKYHIVETPSYLNNNMKSQQGLFLCCSDNGRIKNVKFRPVSLIDYIEAVQDERHERHERHERQKSMTSPLPSLLRDFDGVTLYEIKLSASKAPELLQALDKLSINSSSLFPGMSGCVKTLYERCAYY